MRLSVNGLVLDPDGILRHVFHSGSTRALHCRTTTQKYIAGAQPFAFVFRALYRRRLAPRWHPMSAFRNIRHTWRPLRTPTCDSSARSKIQLSLSKARSPRTYKSTGLCNVKTIMEGYLVISGDHDRCGEGAQVGCCVRPWDSVTFEMAFRYLEPKRNPLIVDALVRTRCCWLSIFLLVRLTWMRSHLVSCTPIQKQNPNFEQNFEQTYMMVTFNAIGVITRYPPSPHDHFTNRK